MSESELYKFSLKQVVEGLIKLQDLHEGVWQLNVTFGITAANIGGTTEEIHPAAIIPIQGVSLSRVDKENNLAADASKVNPKERK